MQCHSLHHPLFFLNLSLYHSTAYRGFKRPDFGDPVATPYSLSIFHQLCPHGPPPNLENRISIIY
jgi:hypothetical protein